MDRVAAVVSPCWSCRAAIRWQSWRRSTRPRCASRPLHGLGQADYPEYAQRLRAILKPFGVKPRLASQSADGVATLFATLEASEGLTVLNDSILDTLPAALVGRPFSPTLAPTVVVLGMPAVAPNIHAETFARLLHEEARQHPSVPV